MLMDMNYATSGNDVKATFVVGDKRFTETWCRFNGQLYTATPVITQVREMLFDGASAQLQKAVSDLSDMFEMFYTTHKAPVAPLLSLISFFEGLAKGKYKCTAEEFAKLRGYADVLGAIYSIDKPAVFAALINNTELSAAAAEQETSKAAGESEYDDVLLANKTLACVVENKLRYEALYTILEEQMQSYALIDTSIYFDRAIPELIGHVRGDLDGTVKAEAIKRFVKGENIEDTLSFIGDARYVNLEAGVARVFYVLSGLYRVYTEVKTLNIGKKGVHKKVLSDLEEMMKSLSAQLVSLSYDFTVSDIEKQLDEGKYSAEDLAYVLLAGSVDDLD